jgi:hypothetical protein
MSICNKCGASFSCGMQDPAAETPCWCTQLPHLPLAQMPGGGNAGVTCLCPSCLQAWIAAPTAIKQEAAH